MSSTIFRRFAAFLELFQDYRGLWIVGSMEKTPHHSFHLRLPIDLFESISEEMHRKGGKSLTKELVKRLRTTTQDDAASQLADALRPLLNDLDAGDRERFTKLAVEAVKVLASGKAKKRGRQPKS